MSQYVTLSTDAPPLSVTALRGFGSPTLGGGVGGWEEVARARRKSLTLYQGTPARTLTLPLLLWHRDGSSVEEECDRLERMGQPPAPRREPPVVKIDGAVPHAGLPWVIATDGLQWADDSKWHPQGFRVMQAVVAVFWERVTADSVELLNAAARIRAQDDSRTGPGTYVVKAGDKLTSIAAEQLGDWRKWTVLQKLNHIVHPNRLTVGTVIRLR